MKFKILVSACAVFAIFAAQANAKESVNTAVTDIITDAIYLDGF